MTESRYFIDRLAPRCAQKMQPAMLNAPISASAVAPSQAGA